MEIRCFSGNPIQFEIISSEKATRALDVRAKTVAADDQMIKEDENKKHLPWLPKPASPGSHANRVNPTTKIQGSSHRQRVKEKNRCLQKRSIFVCFLF